MNQKFSGYFEEGRWAKIRAFNNGERFELRSEDIAPEENGSYICRISEEATKSEGMNVWQLGFEWDQPRDIRAVEIDFDSGFDASQIKEQYVQYWQRSWPTKNPDRDAGARRGWIEVDDAYNGRWVEAYGEIELRPDGTSEVFDHIDVTEADRVGIWGPHEEFNSSEDYNAFFRRTLKLRVMFVSEEPPAVSGFRIIGNCAAEDRSCEIWFDAAQNGCETRLSEKDISIWNGEIRSIESFEGGLRLNYTANTGVRTAGDATVLQFACEPPFGVNAADIEGGVYMEDYGLLITAPLDGITAAEKVAKLTEGRQSIFDRVPEHAEQTVANAFAEIPEMEPTKQPPYGRYVILGWDGLRKKFCLRYNGDIFADKKQQKSARRDVSGTRWAGPLLHFRIASGDPPTRREKKDECRQYMPDAAVPVYVTEWEDREIEYRQTSFATLRDPSLIGKSGLRGDEDIVVMNRIEIRNASDDSHVSRLYIELFPAEQAVVRENRLIATGRVVPDNTVHCGWRIQKYDTDFMRLAAKPEKGELRCIPKVSDGAVTCWMEPGERDIFSYYDGSRPNFEVPTSVPTTLLHEVELGAFETCVLDFAIPYNTPVTQKEMEELSGFDFDEQRELVTKFWSGFYGKAAKMELPGEKHLNDFMKAVPWHIIMTAMREPVTGNYIVPAGTYTYMACGNEACMQIRLMDYLGYHDYAEKYLETYVNCQGSNGLDGNFKSKEGALVAVNYGGRGTNDDQFAYNLDHGYILSCFADHYMLTGDGEWLRRVAKTVVDGCDFVFREREANKKFEANGEKVPYYGLMPHGHLEDNREWRCWFAVNAHACGGILRIAKALGEIGHPDAQRILDAGIEYRDDIRDCLVRAMSKSMAVPNGRGGYIPHLPTQAEIRGRDWGWFREVAYGPLHLVYGLVLDPNEQLTTWILRDLEDNLFISRSYGRIADKEKYWFSRGGITIQSNLLFNDLVYLERNEPERAIRALFNDFAQNLYRDMNCFTEHPIPEYGHGIGPFFKTPDEAQFLVFLRNHLVRETENGLALLQGASREWFAPGESIKLDGFASAYGPVSVVTENSAESSRVEISAKWRRTPGVLRVSLRRPDKKAAVRVLVNGSELCCGCVDGDVISIENPGEKLEIKAEY